MRCHTCFIRKNQRCFIFLQAPAKLQNIKYNFYPTRMFFFPRNIVCISTLQKCPIDTLDLDDWVANAAA